MTKNQISTISEFLLHAGTDYRVFDMGRAIHPVSSQQFLDWELGNGLPTYPRAGHAWFGLVFWDKTRSDQQYIWFVKLPLDEQGKIIAAARNQFLQIIVEALGSQLENAQQKNAQLPDNPCTFIPNQQQLADFNSKSRLTLKLGNSQYFTAAYDYIRSPMVINWQTIALQGLADVVANMHQNEICEALCTHFANYPLAVQQSILTSMENIELPESMLQAISHWLMARTDDTQSWQLGLRALCQMQSHPYTLELVSVALGSPIAGNSDTLAVISGRLWLCLLEQDLLSVFLERTANVDSDFQFFQAIFTDLVRIPAMRNAMLSILRHPDKSTILTQAVGQLFSSNNH
jgi:hypothetical protein